MRSHTLRGRSKRDWTRSPAPPTGSRQAHEYFFEQTAELMTSPDTWGAGGRLIRFGGVETVHSVGASGTQGVAAVGAG